MTNALRELRSKTSLPNPPKLHTPTTEERESTDLLPNTELDRRRTLLHTLLREYILSHDNISPALMAGTEWPPLDWMNKRLSELGDCGSFCQARIQWKFDSLRCLANPDLTAVA